MPLSKYPPTVNEADRTQRFVRSRKRDIEYLSIGIEDEESHIEACYKAISNLGVAILRGKEAFNVHRDNLNAFLEMRARLISLRYIVEPELELELHSRRLYRGMRSCGESPIPRTLGVITQEINLLEKEVRMIWDRVKDLEIELEGWKSSLMRSKSALDHLIRSRNDLQTDLHAAISFSFPHSTIPREIWLIIFDMTVSMELEDYLRENDEVPLRPTPLILSQVCCSWRIMVTETPELWINVAVHTSPYLPVNRYELFTLCLSKAKSPITFVANLTQKLCWSYGTFDAGGRYHGRKEYRDHEGNIFQPASPNWEVAMDGKSYTLHLNMFDDENPSDCKIMSNHFPSPLSLILSSRSSIHRGHIFDSLSFFPGAKALTLINRYPKNIHPVNLASKLPALTSLTFKVEEFPAEFQLAGFLTATLEQLYIRHEAGGITPSMSVGAKLPKLEVLGLSYTDLSLLKWLELPAIHTFVIYGSEKASRDSIPNIIPSSIYGRLHRVELENWREPEEKEKLGAVWLFEALAKRIQNLQFVKFTQSWVDGGTLVAILDAARRQTETKLLTRLDQITLDHITGITREECERLQPMMRKLNIHV